jgi:serine/threonine protein kinase/class 3 adenylate cyclase
MQWDGHRLLAQIGMGSDAVAYRAQTPDGGDTVAVVVLSAARADAERWPELARHLKRVALLHHPGAVGIRALHLEHDPPFIVLNLAGSATLINEMHPPVPLNQALALCQVLAETLAEAHRLGLVHGRIGPQTIPLPETSRPRLDFTGIDWGGPTPADARATDPDADSTGLGRLLLWLLTGKEEPQAASELAAPARQLVGQLLADEPLGMAQVVERLTGLLAPYQATRVVELPASTGQPDPRATRLDHPPPAAPTEDLLARGQIGRFRLLEKLGQGGMGAVFRAEDTSDGHIVAVKVLRREHGGNPPALRRFLKEARLLAEIQSPYVANLLEANDDDGIHYLVLEFVPGRSLDRLLAERGRLEEREALAILSDVARGLAEAHARGIIHRDVKPENILVVSGGVVSGEWSDTSGTTAHPSPLTTHHSPLTTHHAKLSDFGLARHIEETASLNLTRVGAILGTLWYMSPEQCGGKEVDARSDVYSMGATLYHVLAGRPPFLADNTLALINQHTKEPPPPLRRFNPAVSDGLCRVVEKALAKAPDARHADAGALLEDLERLLRGEPTAAVTHPRRPVCHPGRVIRYEWSWELVATPEQLWPYISNTERLNRAAGLAPVDFREEQEEDAEAKKVESNVRPARVRRFGSFRKAGIGVAWEEHPFEWIEARRMGVLREYTAGPFRWLMSITELESLGTGTRLHHRVELEPQGLMSRTLAAIEIGVRGRRALDRIYRRIDSVVSGRVVRGEWSDASGITTHHSPLTTHHSPPRGLVDPFEDPATPTRAQRQRLARLADELVQRGIVPEVAEPLVDWVSHAPPQEVGRIRPLVLARRLALDPEAVVAACLHGAHAGLFVMSWDVICPLCRGPSATKDTLRLLREHERCVACAEEFPLDFGSSVELIFRAHPEVRASELALYCIGGPAHSPHVVAQTRVAPGECVELNLTLGPGAYRLRGPQLAYRLEFRVEEGAGVRRLDLALARPPGPDFPRLLRSGGQRLVLTNDHSSELVVRVERTAPRTDALTAARASSLALFRELFPDEVLSPGQLVRVAAVTLLVTDLEDAGRLYADGDARAFTALHELFRLLGERIRNGGGAVVKTLGEGILASFADAEAAVRVGLALPGVLQGSSFTRGLHLRIGIHRGPALAATVNDQLDYFGTTVRQALALPRLARVAGGNLVLSRAVVGDPGVATLLRSRGLEGALVEANLPDVGPSPVQQFTVP